MDVTPDGYIAMLAAGPRFAPARYTMSGSGAARKWTRVPIEGQHATNLGGLVLSEDTRRVVYDYSTASIPTQWFTAALDGTKITDPMQITNLNPSYAKKEIAKSEVIHWKGANDDEVDGILFYPLHYEAGKKYPLVLGIHGGPAGRQVLLRQALRRGLVRRWVRAGRGGNSNCWRRVGVT